MTYGTDRKLDLADKRAEQEREAGINDVRQSLQRQGFEVCVGCGDEIELERRMAMPSARRCVDCQRKLEKQRKSWGMR